MDFLKEIETFNSGWIYVGILILISIFTTIATRFVQFRHFHNTFRAVFTVHKSTKSKNTVAPITSVFATIAGRAGTGNIIGIALAIFAGGPGVILWIWIFCFMSMATSFCESTLGQVFKKHDENKPGIFRGGSAYYILKGIGKHFRWLAILMAVALIIQKGIFVVSLNVNTITQVSAYTFFHENYNNPFLRTILTWSIVGLLFVVSALVLVGGIKRIIDFTAIISPAFILIYFGLVLTIIFSHLGYFPKFLGSIFKNAFTPFSFFAAAGGASLSYVIRTGAQRSWFSNEAGQGTGPYPASTATIDHPAKQGLAQAFSVFVDSIVVCTLSGFLFSFALFNWHAHGKDLSNFNGMFVHNHQVSGWKYYGKNNIAVYSVMALISLLGTAGAFIFVFILAFFALSSMLVGILIAEFNVIFLVQMAFNRYDAWLERQTIIAFRSIILVIVAISPFLEVASLFTLVDFATAICFIINGLALACLGFVFVPVLKDFDRQYKTNKKSLRAFYTFDPVKLKLPETYVWKRQKS